MEHRSSLNVNMIIGLSFEFHKRCGWTAAAAVSSAVTVPFIFCLFFVITIQGLAWSPLALVLNSRLCQGIDRFVTSPLMSAVPYSRPLDISMAAQPQNCITVLPMNPLLGQAFC